MSKGKTTVIAVALAIVVAAAALLFVAFQSNMLLSGHYYVKVDNAHISQSEDTGGVIHLGSGEPYVYELDAINEVGAKTRIEFGVSRELRQDALLKLELQPIRGVVSWSEVAEDELPLKVAEALG